MPERRTAPAAVVLAAVVTTLLAATITPAGASAGDSARTAVTAGVAAPAVEARTDREPLALVPVPPTARRAQALSPAVAADPALRTALQGRDDRTGAGRATQPFEAVGLTLTSAPSGPVFVRTRGATEWSPWVEADFEPDKAPDDAIDVAAPGAHSEPFWVGGATAYEVDGPADLSDVTVNVVRGTEPTATATALAEELTSQTAASFAGAIPRPEIALRSSWGARPPKVTPTISGDLRGAVVHHAAGSNSYTATQVPSVLRSIQAYHQDVQGWDDIAYNFAVDRWGRTWEARAGGIDRVVLGGHARGFNTGTVGVVVLGDLGSVAPTAAAQESVARIIAWKLALHGVDPGSKAPYTTAGSTSIASGATVTLPRIVGHRDVGSTSCPGAYLYAQLPWIRARVAELVPAYQGQLPAQVLAPDLDGNGTLDIVAFRSGPGTDVRWTSTGSGGFSKTETSVGGTYRAAVGDLDGDGRDDIVWHGSGTAADHIWWSGPSGIRSQQIVANGSYQPVMGDFDGNGRDDVVWYSAGLSADSVWYSTAGGGFSSRSVTQDLISGRPLVGDFDGSGRDDILWYGPGSASDELWLGNLGGGFSRRALSVNGRYSPAVLDATGDGVDDVLWVAAEGSYRWDFSAGGSHVTRSLGPSVVAGTPTPGDFDGDGLDDVLIAVPGGAPDAIWYSTPTGRTSHTVAVKGAYAIVAGPSHSAAPARDDLLFVASAGRDYLWVIGADRLIASTVVG